MTADGPAVAERGPQSGDQARPRYTVRAAAQLLGVPTATLRSWTHRYGIGPAEHRPGAHRLYSDTDLQMLRHMRTLIDQGASPRSAARTAMASATPGYAETAPLLAAAFGLDAVNAALIIERHLRHYGVLDTWDLLVRPVFAVIESRQREGEKCIDIEHMLSWAVARSFQQIPMPPTGTPTSVILACTANETHALPLEALRAALCERGRGVLMLGAAVPVEAVIDALARSSAPRAVVIWSQTSGTADAAMIRTVGNATPQVMAAGPGWDSVRLPPATVRPKSLRDAVQKLTTHTDPAAMAPACPDS
ncbi:MerR family transcriptional regulator [Mycobacterium heckeshornense]|uniref:MerR family transcriptional regulator n=1 Tax=Mycobacterium heckeshornense TaxID=110505 RepID=UPI001943D097|nr:MerR family transcriptional regulator [Mycobacterium heckeshornense]BCQ10748.1 MerR family transcriptional regulator [Mycobacterium heckeshornense]